MMRSGAICLVQAVATWPWSRRVSMRTAAILMCPSPSTVPSGMAPCLTGAGAATGAASAGARDSGFTQTPDLASG